MGLDHGLWRPVYRKREDWGKSGRETGREPWPRRVRGV